MSVGRLQFQFEKEKKGLRNTFPFHYVYNPTGSNRLRNLFNLISISHNSQYVSAQAQQKRLRNLSLYVFKPLCV